MEAHTLQLKFINSDDEVQKLIYVCYSLSIGKEGIYIAFSDLSLSFIIIFKIMNSFYYPLNEILLNGKVDA